MSMRRSKEPSRGELRERRKVQNERSLWIKIGTVAVRTFFTATIAMIPVTIQSISDLKNQNHAYRNQLEIEAYTDLLNESKRMEKLAGVMYKDIAKTDDSTLVLDNYSDDLNEMSHCLMRLSDYYDHNPDQLTKFNIFEDHRDELEGKITALWISDEEELQVDKVEMAKKIQNDWFFLVDSLEENYYEIIKTRTEMVTFFGFEV